MINQLPFLSLLDETDRRTNIPPLQAYLYDLDRHRSCLCSGTQMSASTTSQTVWARLHNDFKRNQDNSHHRTALGESQRQDILDDHAQSFSHHRAAPLYICFMPVDHHLYVASVPKPSTTLKDNPPHTHPSWTCHTQVTPDKTSFWIPRASDAKTSSGPHQFLSVAWHNPWTSGYKEHGPQQKTFDYANICQLNLTNYAFEPKYLSPFKNLREHTTITQSPQARQALTKSS